MDKSTPLSKFLLKRHKTRRPIRSWRDISIEICKASGQVINRGLLSSIANGHRSPPNYIIEAINKTYHKRFKLHEVVTHVMPLKCGHVALSKRCPICHPPTKRARRPTFAEIYKRAAASIYSQS